MVTPFPLWADDRLCQNFGILLCLCLGRYLRGISPVVIHIAVYQGQKVISVRPGRLPEVNNRYPIAINVTGDSAVVPRQVALGVQRQKAHAAGTGVFQIGVQEIGGFAHAGRADHQHMDVIRVHQRRCFSAALTAQNNALRQRLSIGSGLFSLFCGLPPLVRRVWNMVVGAFHLLPGSPAGSAVLTVAHGFVFDTVEIMLLGSIGHKKQHCNDAAHR